MTKQFFVRFIFVLTLSAGMAASVFSQSPDLTSQNVIWDKQSRNSGESMPCGGGDIGLNVWVENGELLFYLSRSGAFDENNVFPKLGRVRIRLTPNPFEGGEFRQELKLRDGNVEILGKRAGKSVTVKVWVDVFRPVVHVETSGNEATVMEAVYESWRTADIEWTNPAQIRASSAYSGAPMNPVMRRDYIQFDGNNVCFYHRNLNESIFDITVKQQGLDSVKYKLWNPLKNLTFGGLMVGEGMKPAGTTSGKYVDTDFKGWKLQSVKSSGKHHLKVYLHIDNTPDVESWKGGIAKIVKESDADQKTASAKSRSWWNQFWDRSFILINPDKPDPSSPVWQVGRNYQLFRYQLGCNAYGTYPTKFNGGLFTFDPSFIDKKLPFTPDHRNWGGGNITAQNQRLVYFPMFKSGDFDMVPSQLNFYLRALGNAELRTRIYWGHQGASFTEAVEQFGLPVTGAYGWNRPALSPKGEDYNDWLEYLWDTQLEFCLMMLDLERYNGEEITKYIPFVESCLTFFNEHYKMLALARGRQPFDGEGHLVLYPTSCQETYKMAYNASTTIAGLTTILTRLLELPANYLTTEKRAHWAEMLKRIPPIGFREKEGHKTISPAWVWERINNQEIPQLYPVYPWGMYGLGKPGLDIAIDTWKYGTDRPNQKNYISWHQDAIFCARLGLTDEAAAITIKKLQDSPRRYPTFWGPGHDYVPDHNWGGSGMIGLQEMVMQTDGKKIYLFPSCPKEWNVKFKLHAPYNTTVEAEMKNGKIIKFATSPESREDDVILPSQ